ncbi:uncharacterized protein DS421_11g341020 [Arachis hypogaea]|nr:uncharacterized protein DS421_11g341020 [Arachis hypogaea]
MAEVDEKFWEEEEVDRFSKVQESFLTSSSTLSILEFMLWLITWKMLMRCFTLQSQPH